MALFINLMEKNVAARSAISNYVNNFILKGERSNNPAFPAFFNQDFTAFPFKGFCIVVGESERVKVPNPSDNNVAFMGYTDTGAAGKDVPVDGSVVQSCCSI